MKNVLVAGFLVSYFGITAAQDKALPFLRDVRARVVVTYDSKIRAYEYTFSIANEVSSIGDLDWFEIHISRDSLSVALDSVGLPFCSTRIERSYRRAMDKLFPSTVSISFSSLPRFGDALLSSYGTVAFSAKLLRPGEQLSGFVMTSRGVPGIRKCIAKPSYDPNDYYPSVDDVSGEEAARIVAQVDSDRVRIAFSGFTVGPISPPADFKHLIWLDTLLSYTRQSAALGWLGRSRDNDCDDDERPDDGITKNIEKRLEKAKKELSKGDSTKARKELEKLVDKVERIWKRSQDEENKHKGEQRERKQDMIMTGEAYALLLYNTEYLIDRLPDGKEKKGEKEKKGGDKDDD